MPVGSPTPPPARAAGRDRPAGRRPLALLGILALLGLGACGGSDSGSDSGSGTTGGCSGFALPDDPIGAAEAAGIAVLEAEGFATHTHTIVEISVDGARCTLPPSLGIAPDGSAIAALHTHQLDNAVHVESPEVGDEFTLGEVFGLMGIEGSDAGVCGAAGQGDTCSVAISDESGEVDGYGTVLRDADTIKVVVTGA